ncbi:MAG: phosphoglucosamine mutase [Gaiellales bacterium]
MRRYFGTDGVRGVVGEDLTPDLVERLGRAFAGWSGGRPVLIGRDTRSSGEELERALERGLRSGGSNVSLGGVLPTPAVALLAPACGAVISASHNPPEYNGVKFFVDGWKLTDADEEAIEARLDDPPAATPGGVELVDGAAARYVERIVEHYGVPLEGMRIAADCANGAMSTVAPEALLRLGARVRAIACEPDGSNINAACGATDLALLRRTVCDGGFELGVAFDGDGDRMLAVDENGDEVDGDRILAILALHLGVSEVAVTAMTNLGFHCLMAERGIRVVTTDVGDRYVLEALRRGGGRLGGEQSGHILWLEGHTSGDGLVAALLLCRALAESGQTLAEAAAVMPVWPQVKVNVSVRTKELPRRLVERVAAENEALAGRGRVLVRPSGTEPVVRVLAEAERAEEAEKLCYRMREVVEEELG